MAKILVIDDENNIRMMVRLALVQNGHTVEVAADGTEGLERFGDSGAGFDLVLLDQRMPGLSGLDVLREIKRRAPTAKVVIITAFGTVDLATEAMRAGAHHFLRKPFTLETLRGAVESALSGETGQAGMEPSPVPFSFDLMTVNGFRLRSSPGVESTNGGVSDTFTVTGAANPQPQTCRVVAPPYVLELVKAHADRDELPGGDRFWQALCGEALANYLWQNAELPTGGALQIEDLTSGLRHWIDAVLSDAATTPAPGGKG